MRIIKRAALMLASACLPGCIASAQPVVSAVLNGASYSAIVSPGCWVAIFGTNLAAVPASAQLVPLPDMLGGVSISVGGLTAPLLYVSPNQINALIPIEVAIPANTVVPLVVNSPGGSSTYNIRLTRDAPAIFTRTGNETGRAFVFDSKFQTLDTVGPQDVVILYATGLGPTDSSGRVVDTVEVFIGERSAEVLFAGLAPGLPGVYQLNVVAPVPATDRVYLRSGGWQSNIADAGIRSGMNTANVSGTIDGLFPSSDPGFPSVPQRPCVNEDDPGPCGASGESFSNILHAGSFTVGFDILPSASPFDVAAVGEAGGAIITIDPRSGTYTASITTLTAAARAGDFSSSISRLWDYASCGLISAVCQPFPASIVPASRMTPYWVRAAQMLPLPNAPATPTPNGLVRASETLGGSRFVINDQSLSNLSKFGGIVQVPYGPFPSRLSTFKLYVDGKLVSSRDLPYVVANRALPAP